MTREEWIKARDEAAAHVFEMMPSCPAAKDVYPVELVELQFFATIHDVACRELALIPIPISCEFDLAKVENAIDEIRMWRNGNNSATTAINNIEALLRSAVAKGGDS